MILFIELKRGNKVILKTIKQAFLKSKSGGVKNFKISSAVILYSNYPRVFLKICSIFSHKTFTRKKQIESRKYINTK